jgi:predicted amidohydrolase
MAHFTIAGLQLNLKAKENLNQFIDKVRATKRRFPFVEMIVGSELSICGAGINYAGPMLEEVETSLCELARELQIWLVPGSIYQSVEGDIYNTSPVINPTGQVIDRFQKLCPFLPYERGVAPGENICVFNIPNIGCFGLYICYDMWFPELSRAMINKGAEVILHPTLTDTCDRSLEKAMTQATAAQQQCYMVSINGAGALGVGQSMVVGPEGDVIHESQCGEETILFEVDLNRVRRTRERGIMSLGQPLKSYRDHIFAHAQRYSSTDSEYLDSLGPIEVPKNKDH